MRARSYALLSLDVDECKSALAVHWPWMGIVSIIIERVLITMFYWLIITPVGLILRMTRRDKLQLRRGDSDSLWTDMAAYGDLARHKRQF